MRILNALKQTLGWQLH